MSFQEELLRTALGKTVDAPAQLDASVLVAIPRSAARESLGLLATERLPFHGWDVWNCWEFAWLDAGRAPHAAVLELQVPADTPNLFESKSLKLYLGGFAGTSFESDEAVIEQVTDELSEVAGGDVQARLIALDDHARLIPTQPAGMALDPLGVALPDAPPEPARIQCGAESANQVLFTHLFQSRCPVTAQPDHASVLIEAKGPVIGPEGLMRYLLGFRDHHAFHEQCAEKIFLDLCSRGTFDALTVTCRFSRRGGIDINPVRSRIPLEPQNLRLVRQ